MRLVIKTPYHLSVLNLRAFLRHPIVDRAFISTVSGSEDAGCDIIFEELLVHNVDNGRNDCLDVLLTRD